MPGTQMVFSEKLLGERPAGLWGTDEAGGRMSHDRWAPWYIDRESGFPDRLVRHRRCPSFCIHPSTSPSRKPCTRGTRRKNQIISPRQLQINHSVPTPDGPNLLTSCPAVLLPVLSTRAAATLRRKIPLQYSRLQNSMDRGVWWATVHGVQTVRHD